MQSMLDEWPSANAKRHVCFVLPGVELQPDVAGVPIFAFQFPWHSLAHISYWLLPCSGVSHGVLLGDVQKGNALSHVIQTVSSLLLELGEFGLKRKAVRSETPPACLACIPFSGLRALARVAFGGGGIRGGCGDE